MAENRYANAKCFVFAPDGYEEITYSELCRRCEMDQSYEEKKYIPLHGMLMEVTPEQYQEFAAGRSIWMNAPRITAISLLIC